MNIRNIIYDIIIFIVIIIFVYLNKNKLLKYKKLPNNLGVSMPGCAFGSLIVFNGYFRAFFDENNYFTYNEFTNPKNTIFTVCSGGNFMWPVFNGKQPSEELFGKYIESETLPSDLNKLKSDQNLGILLSKYNIFDSIFKDFDIQKILEDIKEDKKEAWDATVKEWYKNINQMTQKNDDAPKANFMSMVCGVKPTLLDKTWIEYKYLLFNNLNNISDVSSSDLIVQNLKKGKRVYKPYLISNKQKIDTSYWASSAMGIFSATYITSKCKKYDDLSDCFAKYSSCNECDTKEIEEKKKIVLEKVAINVANWKILKDRILESANLKGRLKLLEEKLYFTDGGVIDVNAIILNLINQSKNLIVFNINQCGGLKSYFKIKGDDSFCFLIQPVFAEGEWDRMVEEAKKNFRETGVEYAVLDNVKVMKNKRFGIKEYTIEKMFVMNLIPTLTQENSLEKKDTSKLFFESQWYNNLNVKIKDYIKKEAETMGDKGIQKGFFLQKGCHSKTIDKYIPKKLDAFLVSNYCTWQMKIVLQRKEVVDFFRKSLANN